MLSYVLSRSISIVNSDLFNETYFLKFADPYQKMDDFCSGLKDL